MRQRLAQGAVDIHRRRWGRGIGAADAAMRAEGMKVLGDVIGIVTRHHGPGGMLARTLSVGGAVGWVVALFAVYLVLYLLG